MYTYDYYYDVFAHRFRPHRTDDVCILRVSDIPIGTVRNGLLRRRGYRRRLSLRWKMAARNRGGYNIITIRVLHITYYTHRTRA